MHNIKVLTLNAWGVFTPFVCDHKDDRIAAVGKKLAEGEFDIVMLEEIWTQADYKVICSSVEHVYPHHHYFNSGMFGSGTCVFSKYPILETFYQKYSVNGYAHKVQHGDWFCGKGVGLAKIVVDKLHVNVYVTHLHAQYSKDKDEYLSHRVSQAFEFSQFIRLTSHDCDIIFAGGDFNLDPADTGYAIIGANAALEDAWVTQSAAPEDSLGTTCDRPDNKYACTSWQKYFPNGQRLDYIMYGSNRGFEISCDKCWLTMRQVPGRDFPFSDHEGVAANFTVRERDSAPGSVRNSGSVEKVFSDALPILEDGMRKVKADQVFYAVALLISVFGLIYSAGFTLPYGLGIFLVIIRFLVTVASGYFFWMAVVLANWELNGLIATRKNINNILKSNPIMH